MLLSAPPQHLDGRTKFVALQEQLASRAQQFRVIEKRLLVRLKDRNAVPMHNLELLLEGTYQQLMELADNATEAHDQLAFRSACLAAGTRLLLLLLRLRFALPSDDASLLEAHLSPLMEETTDQGWEVCCAALARQPAQTAHFPKLYSFSTEAHLLPTFAVTTPSLS